MDIKQLFHQLLFLLSALQAWRRTRIQKQKLSTVIERAIMFLEKKSCSRRTKIALISILLVFLLLGAMIAVSVYFAMRKTTPTHLVEVKLEEGETLEYKVEQEIEIQGNDVQKGEFVCFGFSSLFIVLTLN